MVKAGGEVARIDVLALVWVHENIIMAGLGIHNIIINFAIQSNNREVSVNTSFLCAGKIVKF